MNSKPAADAGEQSVARVSLLELDSNFVDAIAPEHRRIARHALLVPLVVLPGGPWDAPRESDGGIGYLLTKGFMLRELHLEEARSVEPLGPGDLLCPWQEDAVSFARSQFRALSAVELAVLERGFVARATRFPGVTSALLERAVRRSRYMAVFGAIDGIVGIERRLMVLLWTLAERWGEVRDDAVLLPVALQHSTLAQLIAARRPSVSTALGRLQREERIERIEEGWLLRGPPPTLAPSAS